MPPTLPGFYYDEEKKKYFSIQKTHVLPSSANLHTQQSVKAADDKRHLRERELRRQQKVQSGRINRSPLSQDASFWLSAYRLGGNSVPGLHSIAAQMYADSLTSKPAVSFDVIGSAPVWGACSFCVVGNGRLVAAYSGTAGARGLAIRDPNNSYRPACAAYNGHSSADWPAPTSVYKRSGNVSMLLAALTVGDGASLVIVETNSDAELFVYENDLRDPRSIQMSTYSRAQKVSTGDSMADPSTRPAHIWNLAASELSRTYAMATDTGLYISAPIDAHPPTQASGRTRRFEYPRPVKSLQGRAQMSVAYQDANVVISGERSGRVNFTDLRLSPQENGRSVIRLHHSSAVLDHKPTKHPNQLLVHGFSTLSMYDLRFVSTPEPRAARTHHPTPKASPWPPPPSTHNSISTSSFSHRNRNPNRRSKPAKHTHPTSSDPHPTPSKAYIEFAVPLPRHTTYYLPGPKLAYSPTLDIIAACSTHGTVTSSGPSSSSSSSSGRDNHVSLYSTRTGKLLPHSPLTRHKFQHPVVCVDIQRIRDGPESIITLDRRGDLLEWWSHADPDSDSDPKSESAADGNAERGDDQHGRNGMSSHSYAYAYTDARDEKKRRGQARFPKGAITYLSPLEEKVRTDMVSKGMWTGMAEKWEDGDRGPVWINADD